MNNKRQTIWLVSMLSLMVVLSAYYLFTEDSGTSKIPVADSQQVVGQKPVVDEEVVITEVVVENKDGQLTATTKTPENKNENITESQETVKTEDKKTDDEVLDEVASQTVSGRNVLDSMQWERKESNIKKESDLYVKLDNQQSTPEDLAKANNELKSLEEKESIITGIEEELHQQFGEVVLKEENNQYEVLVLAEKLDTKQAANIVELVMKELNVSQNKISIRKVAP
ncbi:SpoIIIAH-like family protein [Paenibacillus sp. CMAA1364]